MFSEESVKLEGVISQLVQYTDELTDSNLVTRMID